MEGFDDVLADSYAVRNVAITTVSALSAVTCLVRIHLLNELHALHPLQL